MKKFLFLLIAMSAIFLISCGGSDSSILDDKTCDPACESWQTCDDGTCKLATDKCASDNDCKDNADGKTVCNADHVCEAPATVTCTAGEKKCNADNVEVCNATGDGWDITECTTPEVCDATSFTCKDPNVKP